MAHKKNGKMVEEVGSDGGNSNDSDDGNNKLIS